MELLEERELRVGSDIGLGRLFRQRLCAHAPLAGAINPHEERRTTPLELERLARRFELRLTLEFRQHPPDRRVALIPDRTGDKQPIDRARHRDVVEPQPFGPARFALGVEHLVVSKDRLPVARSGMRHLEAEAAVRERQDLIGGGARPDVPAGIGNDNDLELETLCRMDREQAHGVGALLLRDRLELTRPEVLLIAKEADKALEIAAPHLLVGTGETHQLPQVRVAATTVPAGEHS